MQSYNQLTPELNFEINAFLEHCESIDHVSSCVQMDSSLNYIKDMPCWLIEKLDDQIIGLCSIFAVNTFEAELSTVVSPSHRHRGIGKSLVNAAKHLLKEYGYKQVLYVCDDNSVSGRAFVGTFLTRHHHTEYTLKYEKSDDHPRATRLLVSKAYERDLDHIIQINVDAFEDDYEVASQFITSTFASPTRTAYIGQLNYKPICTLMLGNEGGIYSINGVAVLKAFQGHGYAKELIQDVLYGLRNEEQPIIIDVDSTNSAAYHLYKKIGFNESQVIAYFVETL